MTTFDKREDAFEGRFAHDETTQFRALARRNRSLAEWAAEKLGLNTEDAAAYAAAMVDADLSAAVDEEVFRRLRKDFDAAGVTQSDHQIRRTMEQYMQKALQDIRERA